MVKEKKKASAGKAVRTEAKHKAHNYSIINLKICQE